METKLNIQYLPTESLIPYVNNARTHSDEQVRQIAASIKEFGFVNPILLDGAKGVIAGHGRLKGALLLKMPEVPTIELSHLSDAQRKAYILADNRLAQNAGWDAELLALELGELKTLNFDLSVIGFEISEIDSLLGLPGTAGNETSEAPPGPNLSERFMIPPFTILNAREGWWQDRKQAWISLGIKSEVGRGDNLLAHSDSELEFMYHKKDYGSAGRKDGLTYGDKALGVTEPGLNFYRNKKKDQAKGHANPKDDPLLFPSQKRLNEIMAQRRGARKASPGGSQMPAMDYKNKERGDSLGRAIPKNIPKGLLMGELKNFDGAGREMTGTSIFDPVLCEILYRWFSPVDGLILDPFAGGSVRGIVANKLGRKYVGHELRPEQVQANEVQGKEICSTGYAPQWIEGDSRTITETCKGVQADFVFSCPPYADLEVYSDNPQDLSTLEYAEFRKAYFEIIAKTCSLLKEDRFAAFVVGEVRDAKGNYYNFVGDTIQAFREAGLSYYNEAILITMVGSLPIRAGKQFSVSRKLGKTHQNILVFLKGNAKAAAEACGIVNMDEVLDEYGEGEGE